MRRDSWIENLRLRLRGEVLDGDEALKAFERDRSVYRIRPRVVVRPLDEEDLATALRLAAAESVPITARGGGSGTGGGALGRGMLLDLGRRGRFQELEDPEESGGSLRGRAGVSVLHARFQARLREEGARLPADPTSAGLSVLGGNVATRASGPHALRHGSIDRYLESLRMVTISGTFIDTARPETLPPRLKAELDRLARDLREDEEEVALLERRRGRKIASGYHMTAFLDEESAARRLCQSLVGSMGTLAVMTSMVLRAETRLEGRALLPLAFRHLGDAGDAVLELLEGDPSAVEIMSASSLRLVRRALPPDPEDPVPEGSHLLLAEWEGPMARDRADGMARRMGKRALTATPRVVTAADEEARWWKTRKLALPVLAGGGRSRKALSVVNDVGLPCTALAEFITVVESFFAEEGLEAAIYGHAGSGNLHLRPLFDLDRPDWRRQVEGVAERVYGEVIARDGTVTAEHGTGPLRAPWLEAEWGQKHMRYMRRLKDLLDPEDLLNPGAIFATRPFMNSDFSVD